MSMNHCDGNRMHCHEYIVGHQIAVASGTSFYCTVSEDCRYHYMLFMIKIHSATSMHWLCRGE